MLTLVLMPPHIAQRHNWPTRLQAALPQYRIIVAEDENAARRELPEADAVFGWVPSELLPLARKLRWLQSPEAGPKAGFYYRALIEHPVTICNPRGIYNDHVSQHALMFVLALARGLPYYVAAQHEHRWDPAARQSSYIELSTATALIAGVGGIGHETARLCAAFGMRVLGVDARWEYPVPFVEQHAPAVLDDLLPQVDFVISTLPHTPETEGMWCSERFARMKSTAYFINVGRGMTTKLDDLADAIEANVIAGCGLDVFEIEPLPTEHKLWTLPNVLLTPHIAVQDAGNIYDRQFALLLENAQRFAAGQPLRNIVDKTHWF